MNIVIMAGGQGTRLWPLSRKSNPKQLLKLINEKTLLQNTYERFLKIADTKNIFLATTEEYAPSVKKQLPKVPTKNFSIETDTRDRGPAIGLATLLVDHATPASVVMFAWSDHYYQPEQKLLSLLKKAEAYVKSNPEKIFSIGVIPTYAHTGLGYMQKGNQLASGLYQLGSFKEKPDVATAQRMVESGSYLWNIGAFVWNTQHLLSLYKQYLPEVYALLEKIKPHIGTPKQEWAIKKYYPRMPKVDIEKSIIEKVTKDMVVAELDSTWADIGSFSAIKDVLSKPNENLVKGHHAYVTSSGNLIYNFTQKQLVSLVGIHNSIIVATDEVILVASRHDTEKIKELLKTLERDPKLKHYL